MHATQEATIPDDLYSTIITGVIALVVLWFVFAVVRKLFGLAVLVALAIGAWMIWNEPVLLEDAANYVMNLFS